MTYDLVGVAQLLCGEEDLAIRKRVHTTDCMIVALATLLKLSCGMDIVRTVMHTELLRNSIIFQKKIEMPLLAS